MCLVVALVALLVEVSWLFWTFIVASLALTAVNWWERRRLGR